MFAVEFVQGAVDLYKTQGIDATIAHYGNPENIDGQWYVFITDENDIFVAHALAPYFVGRNINEIEGIEGMPIGAEFAKTTEEGHWIEYRWPNPETGKLEQKRTCAIRHEGYLFGTGYYEPIPAEAQ